LYIYFIYLLSYAAVKIAADSTQYDSQQGTAQLILHMP